MRDWEMSPDTFQVSWDSSTGLEPPANWLRFTKKARGMNNVVTQQKSSHSAQKMDIHGVIYKYRA